MAGVRNKHVLIGVYNEVKHDETLLEEFINSLTPVESKTMVKMVLEWYKEQEDISDVLEQQLNDAEARATHYKNVAESDTNVSVLEEQLNFIAGQYRTTGMAIDVAISTIRRALNKGE